MSKRREPVDDQAPVVDPPAETEPSAPVVTEPAAPPANGTGVDAIARVMMDNMTPATPEAVAAIRQENVSPPENVEPVVADTTPVKRGRGRPKGSGKSSIKIPGSGTKPLDANSQQTPATDALAKHRITAATLTSITIMTGTIFGGDDFAPGPNPIAGGMQDTEILRAAYFDYCVAKNWGDLPPGIALASALMIYIAPRFTKPQTQTRVKTMGARVFLWFKGLRKKKGSEKEQENEHAAQPVSGNDGERKIDTREGALQDVQKERDRMFGPRPNLQ